ncbi:hypothetical protein CKAN_01604400 [Cinnamomum micranthum f. kanehirae]|uniref:Uncharacterized protein n=1 Tax=Cinnamomum micranthum f. kanehirae TaxID=337451 RepID=A0A3S3N831_9MAGN|nr:hypothetical protein CKAN_01604400 [Cinnamomum micranthum f. kanehirae]
MLSTPVQNPLYIFLSLSIENLSSTERCSQTSLSLTGKRRRSTERPSAARKRFLMRLLANSFCCKRTVSDETFGKQVRDADRSASRSCLRGLRGALPCSELLNSQASNSI